MKLQIEAQHLRVRIDEDELARLLAGDTLASHTQFARAFMMRCMLRLQPRGEPLLAGHVDAWQIGLPEAAVRELAARLPARDGLRYLLPGERPADALELLFDVDVRDSTRKRHGKA